MGAVFDHKAWRHAGPVYGDLAIGDITCLNVDGIPTDFIVVHQGKPSTNSYLYNDTCDGTWLLMKNIYDTRALDNGTNYYGNSEMHIYLNSTFLGMFDNAVQSAIKNAHISESWGSYIDAKIFLLGGYEIGLTGSDVDTLITDGAKLDYFLSGDGDEARALRCATYSGENNAWWLRTRKYGYSGQFHEVLAYGGVYTGSSYGSNGVRPCLIMPSTQKIFDRNSYSAETYGELKVGRTTQLSVDGRLTEFIVVHQGNPDGNLYDSSCNGTWLLSANTQQYYWGNRYYTKTMKWHSNDSHFYNDSDVHQYLNSTFLTLLSEQAQNAIKSVKIPYVASGNSALNVGYQIATGANGLSTKAFLLGMGEMGYTNDGETYSEPPMDGVKLSYFRLGTSDDANRRRKTKASNYYWTRTARNGDVPTIYPYAIDGDDGTSYYNSRASESSFDLRPCIIMPSNQQIIT